MAETIEHVVNVDGATVPFGASTSGKPAMRDKLAMLANTFSFEAFVVDGLYVTGTQARCRILILARHRRTEDTINLRFRLIMEVRDGLIARMEEYHDAAYVEAFMRLVGGG